MSEQPEAEVAPAPVRKNKAQKPNLSDDQIIEQILGKMPTTEEVSVNLPSNNKFYKLLDPGKPITVRAMTFEDERAMMSKKNVNIDVLNILLTRCVSNINIGSLLQMDKLFLIMKLREISYGNEYNATINCTGCRKDNKITFTLSEMPVKYMEEDATDPVIVKLPVLQKTLKVRRPRVEDEQYFANAEFAVNNLWRFVEEIDGYDSKSIISKVLPKLPLKDAHAVLDSVAGTEYGVDTKVRFVCNFCSHNEVMELPIGADFFTGN
jgi:hypothetical protein